MYMCLVLYVVSKVLDSIEKTRANDFFFFFQFVKLSINNHIVGLVHKKRIINEI